MRFAYFLLIFIILLNIHLYSGEYIDTVITFKPGTGQSIGQSDEYFPLNIFGPPSSNASFNVPASSADDVLSLGMGGEIIVSFKNFEIIDGPGPDFTIFENAFLNPATNKIFAEPGKVSVSYNGINYVDFPIDTLTLESCAGTIPTNGLSDPFNPDSSGGNTFDLEKLGLNRIKFIRITDITSIIQPGHPYYDPILSGFDLDAVAGINVEEIPVSTDNNRISNKYSVKISGKIITVIPRCKFTEGYMQLYTIDGQLISNKSIQYGNILIFRVNSSGVFFLKITDRTGIFIEKILIYEN